MDTIADTTESVDLTGRVLGNWRLQRLLGQGGFGAVYRADNINVPGLAAAVKVLFPHMAFQPDIKRRFIGEASAASRIGHQNIVQVFDAGVAPDGLCYVVMELLGGASLAAHIAAGPMPAPRVAAIAMQAGSALGAAHAAGIVHRDLKPENILLVPRDGQPDFVKILDFGIAKLHGDGHHTKTGAWMGTPSHMSPEQWQTLPDIDGRADLYALGIILFQCLTSSMPFERDNPYAWLMAHLNQPPPDPSQRAPVPRWLADIVLRLLAKRREDRFQRAQDVLAALQHGLSSPATPLPTASAATPSTPLPAAPPRRPTPPPTWPPTEVKPPPPPRWRQAALVAAGLVSLVAAGIGARRLLLASPPAPIAAAVAAPPDMVAFGPGTLRIGREAPPGTAALESPPYVATLGRFAIGRTEVSMGEFRAFAESEHVPGPHPWDAVPDFALVKDLPVNRVGQALAERYCSWRYRELNGRLPTEEEWEFAARGGRQDRRLPWPGETLDPARAHVGQTGRLVGLKPVQEMQQGRSPEGLLNLLGNVAEWTHGPARPYPGSAAGKIIKDGEVAVRGGGARTPAAGLDASTRALADPERKDPFIGFRCAVPLPAS